MHQIGFISGMPIALMAMVHLLGCASNDEVAVSNHGEAVRHMIALQTSNPSGGAMGLDGQKAALTLQKYRSDVATPKEVDKKRLGTTIATSNLE